MKKAVIVISAGLMLLAVTIFALPHVFRLKPAREALQKTVENRLGITVAMDHLTWAWFPRPRIFLFKTTVSHSSLDITCPYTVIYPDFAGLIRRQSAGRVALDRPEITVRTPAPSAGPSGDMAAEKRLPFAFTAVQINSGRLFFPATGALEKLAPRSPGLAVDEINADFRFSRRGFDLQGEALLPFAERVAARVSLEKRRRNKTGALKDYWLLDINGEGLDLTEARENVLLLFGEHPVARKVCDIVLGGRVATGHYSFQGYTADFKNLAAMRIAARAEDVAVTVPGINLPLEHGRGPVLIEDAVLTGEDLSVGLGNSEGRNGNVRLDLSGRTKAFQMAVDVDADVAELRDWLINNLLVKKPTVVEEIKKVTRAEGRAGGRLEIGDDLSHPVIKADVAASDSVLRYRRLRDPVRLQHGRLTVSPGSLAWEGLAGRIGPQRIDDSRGAVTWDGGSPKLAVEKIDGRLDGDALIEELRFYPAVAERLPSLVRSMAGAIEIKGLRAEGPLNRFRDWSYSLIAATDELMADTPLLPGKVRISAAEARLEDRRLVLSPLTVELSDQRLAVEADLAHQGWKNYAGRLRVEGRIDGRIAGWVKEKAWIPPRFFPKAPCRLAPLTVVWGEKQVSLEGAILFDQEHAGGPTVRLALALSPDRLDLKELIVSAPDENAELNFCFDRRFPPRLKARFAGSLSKKTLDLLLENNQFLTGVITGDGMLEYNSNPAMAHQASGTLSTNGCFLYVGENRLAVHQAELTGYQSYVQIDRADLALNDESLSAGGRIYFPDDADLKIGLVVDSDYVSAGNLQNFAADLKKMFAGSADRRESGDRFSATGTIDVAVKEFRYNPVQADPDLPVKQFTGHDVVGTVRLDPGHRISGTIRSASICDLGVTGTVAMPPEKNVLQFRTPKGGRPDLQALLDCLGVTDRHISGRFKLDAAVDGTPGNWTGGHIELKAKDGKLKGLVILSKILTLLNVTELFSVNVFKNFFTLGYPYSEMTVSGKIVDNILTVDETKIIGEGLDIFFKGTADLKTGGLDMVAYVKPFKMVDSIVTMIPYVGKTLGEGEKSIAFIPFKIKGSVNNPDVFLIFEGQNGGGLTKSLIPDWLRGIFVNSPEYSIPTPTLPILPIDDKPW